MAKSGSKFGPGILVTAAFIGPGTIATASIAGAQYGFALLWALLFSVFATMALQEMAARLGLIGRLGLAEALRATYSGSWLGSGAILLVVAAIGLGNAAYEAARKGEIPVIRIGKRVLVPRLALERLLTNGKGDFRA